MDAIRTSLADMKAGHVAPVEDMLADSPTSARVVITTRLAGRCRRGIPLADRGARRMHRALVRRFSEGDCQARRSRALRNHLQDESEQFGVTLRQLLSRRRRAGLCILFAVEATPVHIHYVATAPGADRGLNLRPAFAAVPLSSDHRAQSSESPPPARSPAPPGQRSFSPACPPACCRARRSAGHVALLFRLHLAALPSPRPPPRPVPALTARAPTPKTCRKGCKPLPSAGTSD